MVRVSFWWFIFFFLSDRQNKHNRSGSGRVRAPFAKRLRWRLAELVRSTLRRCLSTSTAGDVRSVWSIGFSSCDGCVSQPSHLGEKFFWVLPFYTSPDPKKGGVWGGHSVTHRPSFFFFCGFRALRPPAALQTVGARDAVCPGGRDPRLRQNPLWGPLLERFARPRAGRCATSGATGLGRPHLLFKLLPVSSIKRSS